jgi:hypothetical protein
MNQIKPLLVECLVTVVLALARGPANAERRYGQPPLVVTITKTDLARGCRLDVRVRHRYGEPLASLQIDGMWYTADGTPLLPLSVLYVNVSRGVEANRTTVLGPVNGCAPLRELRLQQVQCRFPNAPFTNCDIDLNKTGDEAQIDVRYK